MKDGIQLDHRYYDSANRLVQTGPEGNLPVGFAQKLNEGLPPEQINGLESRLARFDANGKITRQLILRSDNSLDTDQRFIYDTVGNLTNETRFHYTPAMQQDTTDSYTHNPIARETYKDAAVTRLHIQPPAANVQTDLKQTYDANGYLVSLDDTANNNYDRSLVNDVNGQLLFINQAGRVSRQFIINGEVLGVYGVRPNAVAPTNAQGNPNFAALAEFSFGYQPIASRSLAPSPGNYTTQAGDTLKSIAQRAYGDARLWFRIAEVNSLTSDTDIKIGQTLTIPNLPAGTHNDQNTTNAPGTFNPIGDLNPSLPMPQGQGDGSCGVGNLITTAIAVAVTLALTGPIGLPAASAVGSAAGQVVGNALGTQKGFSWKQVALAAIGGRVQEFVEASTLSNAIGQATSETATQVATEVVSQGTTQVVTQSSSLTLALEAAGRAALTSTITQGIGVVTGLQSSFNWQGVIASAAGAGVGAALKTPLGNALSGSEFIPRLLRGTLSATAAGATTALLQGGKLNTVQIATDAFGNALGRSWVQASQPTAPSTAIEAQYVANAYQANAVEPYNDLQASQDFAREQLRFTAAQLTATTTNPSASIATTSVSGRASTQQSTPAAPQPDGVYIDSNGKRHLRVTISGFTLPDPVTQLKASILDGLDQFGHDAVARGDEWSLALGGVASASVETLLPGSTAELGAGLIAGPVLGKALPASLRALNRLAAQSELTGWLAADLTKAPRVITQQFSSLQNVVVQTAEESANWVGQKIDAGLQYQMIKMGTVLRASEVENIIRKIPNNAENISTYSGDVYASEFVGPVNWKYFYRGDATARTEFLSSMAKEKGLPSATNFLNSRSNGQLTDIFAEHGIGSQGQPTISVSQSQQVAEYFARGPSQNQPGFVTTFRLESRDAARFAQPNYENPMSFFEINSDIGMAEQEFLFAPSIDNKFIYRQVPVGLK